MIRIISYLNKGFVIKKTKLMVSFCKFESYEPRHNGLFNGVIFNTSFVIGTKVNECLNLSSLIIFVGVTGAITIHIICRIKGKTKNNKTR